MEQDLKTINNCFASPTPSADLFNKIMKRISTEKKLIAIKRRIMIFTVVAVFSIVALIPTLNSLWINLSNSGFVQFFSLLFSDGGMMLSYWQSFSLALLESLPILDVVAILAIILACLISIRFVFKDIKNINSLKLAHHGF